MKKLTTIAMILALALSQHIVAQEDDEPYLSAEDIASIEIVLPGDVPEPPIELVLEDVALEEAEIAADLEAEAAGQSAQGVTLPLYHLLILDRTRCALDSDIDGIDKSALVYKLKHGRNGYLIAVYREADNRVSLVLPEKSFIILDLVTNRQNTIREYVNSSAFKKFVSNQAILRQIQSALKAKF